VAYLYSCVRSAAIDMDRSQRRQAARDRAAELPPASAFDPSLERSERQARIESALNQLPADQREVVVMKIWGGLTFAQIGQALGVPLHTAASRYRIALTRLAADLAREMAHE
jgi:RNA polymerase sigma-70 factor (ECF subfamily)